MKKEVKRRKEVADSEKKEKKTKECEGRAESKKKEITMERN